MSDKSEKKLDLIMDMLVEIKTDVQSLKTDIQELKKDMQAVKKEQHLQSDLLHQLVKMVGENNKAYAKVTDGLNTHEHSIDILNRNQLKLETEISKLKNK